MQHTSNYGFNLPDNSDYFDIAHQNSNWSNIDNAMDDLDRRASALTDMAVKGYVATSLLVSDTQMLTDDNGVALLADWKTFTNEDMSRLDDLSEKVSRNEKRTDVINETLQLEIHTTMSNRADEEARLRSLENMSVNGYVATPLIIGDGIMLVGDDGSYILADWKTLAGSDASRLDDLEDRTSRNEKRTDVLYESLHEEINNTMRDRADASARLASLEDMAVNSYVAASLLISDAERLIDDDGTAILADWSTDRKDLTAEQESIKEDVKKNASRIDALSDSIDQEIKTVVSKRLSTIEDMIINEYAKTQIMLDRNTVLTDDDGNSIMADRKTDADALKTEITQLSTQMQKTDIILQNLREAVSDINKRLLKLELS